MKINKILTVAAGFLLASSTLSQGAFAFGDAKFIAGIDMDMPIGDAFKPQVTYNVLAPDSVASPTALVSSTNSKVKATDAASYTPSASIFLGGQAGSLNFGFRGSANIWGRTLVDLAKFTPALAAIKSNTTVEAYSKFEIQEKFIDGKAELSYAMDSDSFVTPYGGIGLGLRWAWYNINATAPTTTLNQTDLETKGSANFIGEAKIGAQFAINDIGTSLTLGLGLSYLQTSALDNESTGKLFVTTPGNTGLYVKFEPNWQLKGLLGLKHAF